jgi:serine/threonine-protein kinase RsbW
MANAQVATPVSQSFHSLPFVELRNSLPSHVELISPYVDQLMRFISRFRVSDDNNSEIELALREALVSAIVHGNQQDPLKRVYVECRCVADGEVSITVEDECSKLEKFWK